MNIFLLKQFWTTKLPEHFLRYGSFFTIFLILSQNLGELVNQLYLLYGDTDLGKNLLKNGKRGKPIHKRHFWWIFSSQQSYQCFMNMSKFGILSVYFHSYYRNIFVNKRLKCGRVKLSCIIRKKIEKILLICFVNIDCWNKFNYCATVE